MFRISRILAFTGCVGLAAAIAPGKAAADCNVNSSYIGAICQVGYNYCQRGFARTDGQLLAISQYQALFSLLGTTYGGDGRTTFALPDLRGRKMVHIGQGPGLNPVNAGERSGNETATLTVATMAFHNHAAATSAPMTLRGINSTAGNDNGPAGNVLAATRDRGSPPYPYSTLAADVDMGASAINVTGNTTAQNTGASQAFSIRDPYLGIQHCIALEGIYPSRN